MNSFDEGRESKGPNVGTYANYIKIGHNAFEFLLDFGQFSPESDRTHVHTRIITGPVFAKALLRTLQESLDQYEHTFGPLADDEGPRPPTVP